MDANRATAKPLEHHALMDSAGEYTVVFSDVIPETNGRLLPFSWPFAIRVSHQISAICLLFQVWWLALSLLCCRDPSGVVRHVFCDWSSLAGISQMTNPRNTPGRVIVP